MRLDGILLVDKPADCTSADVVRAIKRRHRVRRVGHLGTLDPMATGLLPLCVEGGTRVAQFLQSERKAYRGRIRLGISTDTLDVTGSVVAEAPVPSLSEERLAAVARSFLGESLQVPPMYSAVKREGRRLYELAREGREVERAARRIRIDSFRVTVGPREDEVLFEVRCSKGTYVRVLAADLGRALGTVATLSSLQRTEFGSYRISEAWPLDHLLEREPGDLPVLTPREALRGAREIGVDARQAYALAAGQQRALADLRPPAPGDRLAGVLGPDGRLLAVLEAREGVWRLRRVVVPEAATLYRPGGRCYEKND